jgi:predicted RNA-binding Zn-ribbon protein involved in translation (DUF1610 family)
MLKNKELRTFKKCLRCNKELFLKNDYCPKCNQYIIRKRLTAERKAKHLCYDCGKKVKPVYPVRCSCCNFKKVRKV